MQNRNIEDNGNWETVDGATGEVVEKTKYDPEKKELTLRTQAGTFVAKAAAEPHGALAMSFIPEGVDEAIRIAEIEDTPINGGQKDIRVRYFGDITFKEPTYEAVIGRDDICKACQAEGTENTAEEDTADIIRREIESGVRRFGKAHFCPECGGMDFIAYAKVLQTWHVDSRGSFLDMISDSEDLISGPNDTDYVWNCHSCGKEACACKTLRLTALEAERMLRSALGSQDAEIKADGLYCYATSGDLRLHSDEVCGKLLEQLGLHETYKPYGLLREAGGLYLAFMEL